MALRVLPEGLAAAGATVPPLAARMEAVPVAPCDTIAGQ